MVAGHGLLSRSSIFSKGGVAYRTIERASLCTRLFVHGEIVWYRDYRDGMGLGAIVHCSLQLHTAWLGLRAAVPSTIDNRVYPIRERGSVLYLGMAKEISKYHTDAPAGKRPKKLLPPKPSMQTE